MQQHKNKRTQEYKHTGVQENNNTLIHEYKIIPAQ